MTLKDSISLTTIGVIGNVIALDMYLLLNECVFGTVSNKPLMCFVNTASVDAVFSSSRKPKLLTNGFRETFLKSRRAPASRNIIVVA
jgi:hypothetical protein